MSGKFLIFCSFVNCVRAENRKLQNKSEQKTQRKSQRIRIMIDRTGGNH